MRISLHNLSNAGRFAGALLLLCCAACGPRQLPDPLTPEEHLLLGKAYEHQGDIERAAGQYATASAVVPEGDFYLGNLSAAAGQDQTALDYYRKAQPDMPDDPHLNNNLAWVLCRLGSAANDKKQLQEAEALARKAVAAAPPALLAECRDTLRQIRLALSGKAPAVKALPPSRRRRADPAHANPMSSAQNVAPQDTAPGTAKSSSAAPTPAPERPPAAPTGQHGAQAAP